MTAWVIAIRAGLDHHLDIALEHSLWDLPEYRAIAAGDDVFFWQAPQKGLAAWARASSDVYVLDQDAVKDVPWTDKGRYTHRVHIDEVVRKSIVIAWKEVRASTGITGGLNFGPVEVPPADTDYFRGLFQQ